ncbi:pyrroline-5-carboxylate reductase 1, mitochondrial-like [Porites lutea]|uniref:pyrroline-5-carboxylate reductase 1, mitochondrial-like n=1 Tax=Porites lutea TaxID=51062 RepID=UPI003CC64CE8
MSLISRLGFIGGGKAAQVLAKGFLSAGVIKPDEIFASAPSERDLNQFQLMGCNVTNDNKTVMKESNLIFLAIKAKVFPEVLKEISPVLTRNHLVASIAAGVTLDFMQRSLPGRSRSVRLMLNTPVQFREGVTAVTFGKFATDEDYALMHQLMSSVGYCFDVDEELMDVMTALTGGGPAYVYLAIEALADGAVRVGLNRQEAMKLAAKTAAGAARMVLESGQHPGELKDAVCSAGGSTIAGIQALEESGFRGSLIKAVYEATKRAKELGTNGINGISITR